MPADLSAILIAGRLRHRAQRTLEALYSQTAVDLMEVVVLDLDPDSPPLQTGSAHSVRYVECAGTTSWGEARYQGVMIAEAPIVAFMEDHCVPVPRWAEALLAAHQAPWAAIGYVFANANPRSYVSRAGFLADYGLWADPARDGRASLLPGNNVSYKKSLLLPYGTRLPDLLTIDYNLQEALLRDGHGLALAADALAHHENHERLAGLFASNFTYTRLMAARRAVAWSRARRLLFGLVAPAMVPPLRLVRLAGSLRRRRTLWQPTIAAAPVIVLCYAISAIGEALGYLLGEGDASRKMTDWELNEPRRLP